MPTSSRHSPSAGASVIGIEGSTATRDQARQWPVQHNQDITRSAIPTAMAPAGMSGPYQGATPSHGVTESTVSPASLTALVVQFQLSSAAFPAQSTTESLK